MNSHNYRQSSTPPPSYDSVVNNNRQEYHSNQYSNGYSSELRAECMSKLNNIVRRYEINPTFAEKLLVLKGYEIVFICDDSGSMNAPAGEVTNPYEKQRTRWDELKQIVSIVIDIASIFDSDGVDIYFLNREPMFNVYNSSELEVIFALEPEGATPIVPVLRQVLIDKRNIIHERKLLILLATDGIPTDERERPDIHTLEHVLKYERQPTYLIPVTIIACTDDHQCMNYLNDWDKKIPDLDVVDDYRSECKEIQAYQGKNFPFSFGDYLVKILIGSIDSWFDNLDENESDNQ